jgi:DNA-binding response OmpR family regulator
MDHTGPMRVLVVEDDRRLAEVLRRGLAAEGYVVDLACDGHDGFEHGRRGDYDAIVLDIMLPGLNGYRVCARLREQGVATPILMLTAKDGEYDEAEGLDTGADDYMVKPFSYPVLMARLRALIRRSRSVTGARLRRLGDLVVDPATKTCRRGDQPIDLAAKEFAVLEYLVSRAGEVVPKDEIIDHVWDYGEEPDPNLIEVYVCALRRKIDKPFNRSTIHTVRGHGYRLSPSETQ